MLASSRAFAPSLLTLFLLLLVPAAAFAGGAGSGGHGVITHIAVCMVAASGLALLMKVLKQPLILGYVLGGVLIGPVGLGLITDESDIVTVAEIGLILLLFMIGLEIDLKKMLAAGRLVIVTGLLQFPICVALGYGLFSLLGSYGVSMGSGSYAVLYAAVAIGISSTMIVVKLLYDKLELDTLPGRITVGILIFQDIWAIIVLAIQPNLADPRVLGLLQTFGAGALLVVAALAASRYVLPHVFRRVSKVPELLLVLSLGWCFLVGLLAAHPLVGLSMEMGALIAGSSLATFPYNVEVTARVLSIRDFFITLFFVALGMQIPIPTAATLTAAALIAAGALGVRAFGIFGILQVLGAGHRTSLLTTINLSQVSEFSLVILAMGVGLGHIGKDLLTAAIWAFAVLAVASTYQVTASETLQRLASRALVALGLRDRAAAYTARSAKAQRPIVVLGFFRAASAFVDAAGRGHQHLLEQLKVVDFNPEVRQRLEALGIPCVYGDVSQPETLNHAEIKHAKVVLCTIPDAYLRGTTNERMLQVLRGLCPSAKIIVTAENASQAAVLYAGGADFVLQPAMLVGNALVPAVEQALHGSCQPLSDADRERLDHQDPALEGVLARPRDAVPPAAA